MVSSKVKLLETYLTTVSFGKASWIDCKIAASFDTLLQRIKPASRIVHSRVNFTAEK